MAYGAVPERQLSIASLVSSNLTSSARTGSPDLLASGGVYTPGPVLSGRVSRVRTTGCRPENG